MTIQIIGRSFSKDQFRDYVENEVSHRMAAWRPRGACLHNTSSPTLAQFYKGPKGPITGIQRIQNMIPGYEKQGWRAGPHCYVTDREILAFTPLWQRGVHSPGFNTAFWGVELAGEYATEVMPPALRDNAIHVFACLYSMIGQVVNEDTFKFHRDDKLTTHRGCPGKNVGTKAQWIKDIAARMAALHPGGCACAA